MSEVSLTKIPSDVGADGSLAIYLKSLPLSKAKIDGISPAPAKSILPEFNASRIELPVLNSDQVTV